MAETYDFDLICIGSGPAGQRAAIQAAKLGKRVSVVERQRVIGGVCLTTGTIPSKTLREAVLALRSYQSLEEGHGPPRQPSAERLYKRVEHVMRRETETDEAQLRRNNVSVLWGEAAFSGPHSLTIKSDEPERTVSAANFLIAVGSRPASPPDVEADGQIVVTSDHLSNLDRLPKSMAVVGGGVIGIEYAAMFAVLGVDVTLIDRRDRLLEFMDYEIVDDLTHQMRNSDVVFRLGEAVEHIEVRSTSPRRAAITLESGKRIVAEMIFYAIGRIGATQALNVEAAGLTTDQRGRLEVDEMFRTAVPHIYAAGDVIGFPALAATSSMQGRLAACHMFGAEAAPMAPHFPIGIYSIPEMSMVGKTEQELTKQKVSYEIGMARYRETTRGQMLDDHTGLLKMLFHRESRELLGVHAIGTGATELIHVGQAVLRLNGGLDYFLDTVFNYPTLAECYKVAALDASNKLLM